MAKAKPKLTEQQRAERVLCSLGRAIGMLDSFPVEVKKKLTALCSETGEVTAGGGDVLSRYWDSQKATVDEG